MQHILLCTNFTLDIKNTYQIKNIYNQETGEIIDLTNFKELEDTKFYVENLSILYTFLIKICFKNKFKNVLTYEKLHNNTFCFNEKNGNCSTFFIQTKKYKIIFVNFATKFGVDFSQDYAENKVLLDYAITNNRTANSLGTDAYNEYLHTFLFSNSVKAREIARENYPELNIPLLDRVKDSVAGFQMVKKGYYENVYSYDITSSYPAILYNDTPYGKPFYFKNLEDVPHTYFYIVKFFVYQPRALHIDYLNLKKRDSNILTLTKKMFELFKKMYSCTNISILEIIAFKTRKNHFHKFLNKNIVQGKEQETNPRIKKYNKLFANSIVGYFGRNNLKTRTTVEYNTNKSCYLIVTHEQEIAPLYLPLYLAVLDTAKSQFIQTITKYQDIIIYANTDGFLTLKPIDINELNRTKSSPIGSYKEKCIYKHIYIECINGYCGVTTDGEIDNTISGMTLEHAITPEQYRNEDYSYYINTVTPQLEIKRTVINKLNTRSTIP